MGLLKGEFPHVLDLTGESFDKNFFGGSSWDLTECETFPTALSASLLCLVSRSPRTVRWLILQFALGNFQKSGHFPIFEGELWELPALWALKPLINWGLDILFTWRAPVSVFAIHQNSAVSLSQGSSDLLDGLIFFYHNLINTHRITLGFGCTESSRIELSESAPLIIPRAILQKRREAHFCSFRGAIRKSLRGYITKTVEDASGTCRNTNLANPGVGKTWLLYSAKCWSIIDSVFMIFNRKSSIWPLVLHMTNDCPMKSKIMLGVKVPHVV